MKMNRRMPVHGYPTNVTEVYTDATGFVQAMSQHVLVSESVTQRIRDGSNVVQIEYGEQTVFVSLEEVISHWIQHTKPFSR